MTHFMLSVCTGAVAGALCAIPMLAQRNTLRACLASFCIYLFVGIVVFHSDMPYLPWWADGMAVVLMFQLPLLLAGKEQRATFMVLLNALLLGLLISLAEHFIG